jgi:hypothetical protein
LTLWNKLRELLKLDILFVCEMTVFMHDLEGVLEFAIGAVFGFLHFCIDEINRDFGLAPETGEDCSFHFRVNIAAPDDYASEADESVDFFLIETAHT